MRRIVLVMSVCAVLVLGTLPAGAAPLPQSGAPSPTPTAEPGSGTGFGFAAELPLSYRSDTPGDRPILLRQAPFTAFGEEAQRAWGNVQHRRTEGGEVLHFAPNFRAEEGAALQVVLSASPAPTLQEVAAAPVLAELGALEGARAYDVPADQDFQAVVIYDRGEDVVFAVARLGAEPACETVPRRGELALMRPEEAPDACLAVLGPEDLNLTGTPPEEVDIDSYRLAVEGRVGRELSLSLADLRAFPATSEVLLLICSGFFADTVEWTGVPLPLLLEAAEAEPDFTAVRLEAMAEADGYWALLKREDVDPADIIIAYQVDGQPIPLEHGYPVRVVIRDEYGSKWVKWLQRIEVVGE